MHVAELCARAGLSARDKHAVEDILDDLEKSGLVKALPGNRYKGLKASARMNTASGSRSSKNDTAYNRSRGSKRRQQNGGTQPKNTIEGYFSKHVRGFGFVYAEDGKGEVFIPPPDCGGALHGDRVRIRVTGGRKGREGEVIDIISRRKGVITGRLDLSRKRDPYFVPDDARFPGPIPIEGGVPKNVDQLTTVLASYLSFPEFESSSFHKDTGTVEIVNVLGDAGTTTVEVEKIKLREGVVEAFPEDVLAAVAKMGDHVPKREIDEREDLRDLSLLTIDPHDARDHDDAVFAEKVKAGFRVVIAIADVSHYVQKDSALDREARERCNSIYLPDRAIPMLPHVLSANLASLVQGKDRLAMALEVILDPEGQVLEYTMMEAVVRSRALITYEGAAQALGLTKNGPKEPLAHKHLSILKTLYALSKKLRKNREKRGSLDFDLPEARLKLDQDGNPIDAYRSRSDPGIRDAYRIVEEMMLLANEVVAGEFKEQELPGIFRVHGKPDQNKLERFMAVAHAYGWRVSEEEVYDQRLLAKFLRSLEGASEADVLRSLLLRAMQQAQYDTNPKIGHFGLATDDYLHFTSPIRRYTDLSVHRIVRRYIHGDKIQKKALLKELNIVSADASRLERRAMTVERDVVSLYRAILMRDRVGEHFAGTVTSLDEDRVFVSLDAPFVDVVIDLHRYREPFNINQFGIEVTGRLSGTRFMLGQKTEVHILGVNLKERTIEAEISGMVVPARNDNRSSASGKKRDGRREKKRGNTNKKASAAQRPLLSVSTRGGKSTTGKTSKKGTKRGKMSNTTTKNSNKRQGKKRRRK